jgi:catechol 2,3-dioxygenase-like lactoylglutathione lyase family enzyme
MIMSQELAYVALVSNDVEATATVFERHLELARTDCAVGDSGRTAPVFSVGRSALAVFPVGDPFVGRQEKPGVHHIALAVPDPEAAGAAAGAAGVAPVETRVSSVGLGGKRRLAVAPEATAGVKTYFTEPLTLDRTPSSRIERIDHLGVASADNAAAIDVFCKRLGCPLESQQTDMEVQIAVESFTSDKYGVVYHNRPPVPVGGLRVAFITVGDCELEFLQNFDPRQGGHVEYGTAGNTRQDQGAIARFVASRGPGLHHLALKSPDINDTLKVLERAGLTMIDTVGRPGSRRALIGFVHPKSLGGILLHVVERP